jgi:hypothetical protein
MRKGPRLNAQTFSRISEYSHAAHAQHGHREARHGLHATCAPAGEPVPPAGRRTRPPDVRPLLLLGIKDNNITDTRGGRWRCITLLHDLLKGASHGGSESSWRTT